MTLKILIIEARYYEGISDALLKGALEVLQKPGVEVTKVTVPGALEIPHVISYAEAAKSGFDGYVALGCVIRGETTHYDYVCQESARAIMDLAVNQHLAIGNGKIIISAEAAPEWLPYRLCIKWILVTHLSTQSLTSFQTFAWLKIKLIKTFL